MKKREETIEIRIRVANKTRDDFRRACFLDGEKTMTEVIEKLIEGYIQKKNESHVK